jgi:capsular exopolysaccharide synthesis family protein
MEIILMIRRQAWVVGAFVGMALVAALALLAIIQPKYTATSAVLLDPKGPGLLRAEGEFSSRPVDSSKVASVVSVILSDELLDRVVKSENLVADPEFTTSQGLGSLLRRALGGSVIEDMSEAGRIARTTEVLRTKMQVEREGFTYVIRIDVASGDPAKAQKLAQVIAQTYLSDRVEARLISPPRLPTTPSFPKPAPFLLAALVLGAVAGAAAGFLREQMDNTFSTPEQIETRLDVPVIASVPLLKDADLQHGAKKFDLIGYTVTHPLSWFAESLRRIRVSLHHDRENVARVVQFTSPMPGEGKSSLAMCVGVSSALAGTRTILIDCDFRHRSLTTAFQADGRAGVSDFLFGSARLQDVIVKSPVNGLSVIPAGSDMHVQPDFVNLSGLQRLIALALSYADFVILDTAALEAIVDGEMISQVVDQTIIVAKWRYSDRELLARTLERIQRARGRVTGVVLNSVDLSEVSKYGYWSDNYIEEAGKNYSERMKPANGAAP